MLAEDGGRAGGGGGVWFFLFWRQLVFLANKRGGRGRGERCYCASYSAAVKGEQERAESLGK